jgi:hypothetical protein
VLDHLIQGYFGTWGMYGLRLADAAAGKAPAMRTDELPVIRRFYEGPQQPHSKYDEMFFDMVRAAEEAHSSLKEMVDTHPDLVEEHEQKHGRELDDYRYLNRAARQESKIRKEMEFVRDEVRAGRITPQEARLQLDELAAERNALMREVVEEQ